MTWLMDWLLYQVPWWLWAALAAGALIVVLRVFGWRVALGAAGAAIAALGHVRGGQLGYRRRQAEQDAADRRAREQARRIEDDVARRPETEIRTELDRWSKPPRH